MLYDERPTAVYRTTISTIILELLYVAGAAFFIYVMLYCDTDTIWVQIFLGLIALMALAGCIYPLKHRKDRIIVTPGHLSIMNTSVKKKDGKWSGSKKAQISWYDIKEIHSSLDVSITNRVSITKQIFVTLRNGTQYCIDPDIYDVFFLELKLKEFLAEYGRKR